ncbi:hypothetical protein EMCRGX_G027855 [Ephydatia muelleri]
MTPSSPPLCVWTKGGAGLSCCGCIGDCMKQQGHFTSLQLKSRKQWTNEDKYSSVFLPLIRNCTNSVWVNIDSIIVPQASDHTPCIAPELCLHVPEGGPLLEACPSGSAGSGLDKHGLDLTRASTSIFRLPTNEDLLCKFVAWMLIHNLSHPTMKRRVTCPQCTTCRQHATWGDPIISSMPKLEYVLRGAKVERAKMQQGTKRVPITPVILRNKQTLVLLWLPEIRRYSLLGQCGLAS